MPLQVIKPSYIEIHRRRGQKNIPPFRNLSTSATDSLLSLISFSNVENTVVYYNIVKYDATNMTSVTGNSRSGTDIDSENVSYPVTRPE